MNTTAEMGQGATFSVLRRDGVTLWRQIAGQIESEIASGACKQGARLPTEAELSARFGVNRHTVRRALEENPGHEPEIIDQEAGKAYEPAATVDGREDLATTIGSS